MDKYHIHADCQIYFKDDLQPLQGDLHDFIFAPDTESFVQLLQDKDIMEAIAERSVFIVNVQEVRCLNVQHVRITHPEK